MMARLFGRTGAEMASLHWKSTAFASATWMRLRAVNHRFDKLGNPLPLELHGCGCGLCARQQRALNHYWEAR